MTLSNYKIFVLAPHLETNDENLDYYYDFSQSIQEYTQVFLQLNIAWQWQPITAKNYKTIINNCIVDATNNSKSPLFLNLCDGDDVNEVPGISIIYYLKEMQVKFTGASDFFYHITTSKQDMKLAFDQHNVANAQWFFIKETSQIESLRNIDATLYPLIVKPAISGGSMGVAIENVVDNFDELQQQIHKMFLGYRGWNLHAGGIVIEQFITGPEFTVFITGNYNQPKTLKVYMPVERVFNDSLSDKEKFLSFDRLWEIYETETQMPNNANFYEYALPASHLIKPLQQLTIDAYIACKGNGYARADIRIDAKTNRLFVLEINAQCGLSEDENFTSIGAILKFSDISFSNMILDVLMNALEL
jgi:D-alanine-D-alanine ligase